MTFGRDIKFRETTVNILFKFYVNVINCGIKPEFLQNLQKIEQNGRKNPVKLWLYHSHQQLSEKGKKYHLGIQTQ